MKPESLMSHPHTGRQRGRWRWAAVVAYAAAIFVQSALPSPVGAAACVGLDKIFHAAVYALLAVLLGQALAAWPMQGRPLPRIAITAVLLAALYGASDELHQALVPQRHAAAGDLIADFAGSVLGAGAWALRRRRKT